MPYEKCALSLRNKLEKAHATLDDKAWDLYVSGRIEKEEFIELAGHKAFQKRSKKAA